MLRKLLTPLLAVALLVGAAGCSTTASAESSAPTVSVQEGTIVIDVRTPEEYAAGHLVGAILLDLNSGEFAEMLPSLDPNAEYLVYCRSGNRSGQAVAMMVHEGFVSVTNLGSVEAASIATGLPIVTD